MNELNKLLIQHHIIPGYKGYEFIKYILANEEVYISNVNLQQTYEYLAKKFNTTSQCVSRNIRWALNKSDIKGGTKSILARLQIEYRGW